MKIIIEKLTQRTLERPSSNEELKHEIAQRKEIGDFLSHQRIDLQPVDSQGQANAGGSAHLSRRLLSAEENDQP